MIREPQSWPRGIVICILYCGITVIYVTVAGGTCNVLSVFWREWKSKTPMASRKVYSLWRALLNLESISFSALLHLNTNFRFPPLTLRYDSLWTAGSLADEACYPEWFHSARFPWNTKQLTLTCMHVWTTPLYLRLECPTKCPNNQKPCKYCVGCAA